MTRGDRRFRRAPIAAVTALAVLLAVQAAPAASQGPRAELYVVCDMFATRIPVPVERLEGYVPPPEDGYRVQQVGGMATVQPVAASCSFPDVEGPEARMDYSLLGVILQSPSGGTYDAWEVSDNSVWHSINASFGKYSPVVPGVTFDVQRLAGHPVFAHQDVPWPRSSYSMEAVVDPTPAVVPPDLHVPSHHWFQGPRGDVHRSDDNFGVVGYGATVTIDAEPGSELAVILGTEHITLPGAFLHFEAVDTWELTELPPA